ncbi:ubiquinone anaerobic biosynthesis accessory factor UbiT [Tahibacter caeni]|uniref:ubiquinone anaerobic biosynthesis accessory factor UbiT n=1 Tax=Tahibacter caeni TaxID=1453545 RepID=UPI002147CCBB|nr:SCP2 sterol-binding domain-containing protein [Tahibacter caeni]
MSPSLLRLLPPPRRWAPLLHLLPRQALAQAFEHAAAQVLAGALQRGELSALEDRVLGIEVLDLPLRFAVRVRASRLQIRATDANDARVQARVRATLTDLLLLSGRLEDADTLFFQRRLGVDGDTELVLTARNLLDRLDWEQVPLALRIVLTRAARLADAARAAWRAGRDGTGPQRRQ